MGLSQSVVRVLIVGLSGSGKTFLLDLLSGENASGRPTNGYHEISYQWENIRFIFTEYGGAMDWEAMARMDTGRPFACIYFVVSSDIHSAHNALLMIESILPNLPIVLIWNMGAMRTQLAARRIRAQCSLPRIMDKQSAEECLERIYRLLRWTSALKNTA